MAVFTIFDSSAASREAVIGNTALDASDPLSALLGNNQRTNDVLSNLSGLDDDTPGPLVGAIGSTSSVRMLNVISPTGGSRAPTPNMQLLRITGTTGTAGLYDAEVVTVNPDDNAVTVIRTGVRVRAISGTFAVNDIVQASRVAYTTNPHAGFAAKQIGIGNVVSVNGDTTASQQIAVGDAGSDLNIATTAAAYDNAKTYSKGWVVLSSGSTYRFINATPSAGHSPPNATYWEDVTGQGLTIVNVPDISIPSSITSINSSSVAAQNITVKTYPNSYGIPYLASSISGVAWSSAVTYLANAVVTVGSTPYRALSLNTNLDPTTNPGTWVDITSQALWVLNLPDAGWTDGLQTKSGFVTDTVQIFDGAKTWNADGTFVHNLAVGDDLTVSGKTNCTHVRTSTGDSAGRVYGTYSLDDADPAYELRCYQKNVDVLGTPYDLSCALVVQANGGFNFLRASNAANTAGPPRIRVQTAGGPDHVDEVFSGTFATGYTGTANGMEFTSGWYTGTGSDFIEINPGYYSAENKNGSTIDAGMACAVHSSGTGVIKASSTDNTKIAVGLMQATTADTVSGNVQTEGLFTLSDWTAVIGASSLAAKTTYFLDPSTPGKLTATVPTTTGQTVQIIGTAVSATTLDLDIGVPILL